MKRTKENSVRTQYVILLDSFIDLNINKMYKIDRLAFSYSMYQVLKVFYSTI